MDRPRRSTRVLCSLSWRSPRVLCVLSVALCAQLPAGGTATAAEQDIGSQARALSEAARSDAAPPAPAWLRSAADRLSDLVVRARETDADAEAFRDLGAAGEALARRVEATRRSLEAAAGDDESALETLLRSEDWQSLGYAAATLSYWNAWSRLELSERLPAASAERKALAERAARGFEESTRSLSVPGLSAASLLGLGLARLATGELDRAQVALERLDAELDRGAADDVLRVPALRALVELHVRRGDLARAAEAGSRIPAAALSEAERRDLLGIEAAAALQALREGRGDPARAAQQVRELAAAGGDAGRRAASLASEYRAELRGQDLGPLGSWLAAEEALKEKRYAEARDLYAALLADPPSDLGLDLRQAHYGYALSLYETGALESAAQELDRVLSDPPSDATARSAALLRHGIAERLLREEETPERHALAAAAAAQVLRLAPDTVQADTARVRLARESGRTTAALTELSRVAPGSPAGPAALWERIRLRAAQLEKQEARGRRPAREAAVRLADDIDAAERLARQGRLAVDDAEPVLSLLRAKAARWSGAPEAELRGYLARARAHVGADPEARRALLTLELRVLAETADFAGFSSLLAASDDAQIRRELPLLQAALLDLEERGAPAALRVDAWARLAPLAPAAERPAMELGLARALLDHGQADEAARKAKALVDADPVWGDAWWVYARALDAGGEHREAAAAWRVLSDGMEPDAPRALEARLGLLRALGRSGALADACEVARHVAHTPQLPDDARDEVDRALERCRAQGAPEAGKP